MHIEIRIKKSAQAATLINWLNSPINAIQRDGVEDPKKKATVWSIAFNVGTELKDTLWIVEGDYHVYKDTMYEFEPDMKLLAQLTGSKGILAEVRVHFSYFTGRNCGYAEFLNGYQIASWRADRDRPELLTIISKDIDKIGLLMKPEELFPRVTERSLDQNVYFADGIFPKGEVGRYFYYNSVISKTCNDGIPTETVACESRCYYKACDFNMLSDSFDHICRLSEDWTNILCRGLNHVFDAEGEIESGKMFHEQARIKARVKRKKLIKLLEEHYLSREFFTAIDQRKKSESEEDAEVENCPDICGASSPEEFPWESEAVLACAAASKPRFCDEQN